MMTKRNASPLPRAGEGQGEGAWLADRHVAARQARNARKTPTEAEKLMWLKLRNRQLGGYKFKRQFPVPPYIADFACPELHLIVEIDGGQHNENPKDVVRTRYLESKGYQVVRFWNNEVLENVEGVLGTLTLTLSRRAGEGTQDGKA